MGKNTEVAQPAGALPKIGFSVIQPKRLAIKDLTVVFKTGIHLSTLSTWKSRRKYPRADDSCKIAKALNTTVEYLVTGFRICEIILCKLEPNF